MFVPISRMLNDITHNDILGEKAQMRYQSVNCYNHVQPVRQVPNLSVAKRLVLSLTEH